jgi:putative hemolysin
MKNKKIAIGVVAVVVVIAAAAALLMLAKPKAYSITDDGILSYGPRPAANYTISLYNDTENATIYRVVFWSRDRNIYGLLSLPKNAAPPYTAFILLPANSIPKESEQSWLGIDLNKKGYAAFSIDQRGVGETGDVFLNANLDVSRLRNGEEPEQFKMFYDALAAFDVLNSNSDVLAGINKSAIYMAGESMGGRVAIIAGAMEPRVAGVMGISTSGFGRMENQDYVTRLYVRAIDPDTYVQLVSPRKVLLLHSIGDQTIVAEAAARTMSYASEPKKLFIDEGSDHGYYRHEKVLTLNEGLKWLFGSGQQPVQRGGTSQIANPASTHCVESGGTLLMKEEPAGQAGYCVLAGNATVCEEWSYFRNETGGCVPFNERFFG